MSRTKLAVIGAGHLGRIHAKLAASIDQFDVIAIADPHAESLAQVEGLEGVQRVRCHDQIIESIDAAIIAAPTFLHAEIATDLLSAGKHLFVEKPITLCPREAARLTMLARNQEKVLQVGHVERFNPAWQAASDAVGKPNYIEAVRASSFPGRCLDAGVVMDLMIHDLDLVLSIARGPLRSVEASGSAVVTEHEDIAEARLTFDCGLVAALKASRISPEALREMKIYGDEAWATIDFGKPEAVLTKPHRSIREGSFRLSDAGPISTFREELFSRWLAMDARSLEPTNAILQELREFEQAIAGKTAPRVDGQAATEAVDVAAQILSKIQQSRWMGAKPATSAPARRAA